MSNNALTSQLDFILAQYEAGTPPCKEAFDILSACLKDEVQDIDDFVCSVDAMLSKEPLKLVIDNS